MAISEVLSSFWEEYNSEESWKPLVYPFLFWAASYLKSTKDWHEWYSLHNFHNLCAIALALISMSLNNDVLFNERVGILFSFSYFLVDLVDTTTRLDGPYIVHAVCVLGLGGFNYSTPLCRQLRMNSKAALLETSSPFLHYAKQTRNPVHFAIFAIVFTLCRIVWVPCMMKQLHQHGMPWTDIRILIMTAFYALNLFWYAKILKILIVEGLRIMGYSNENSKDKNKDNQHQKKD